MARVGDSPDKRKIGSVSADRERSHVDSIARDRLLVTANATVLLFVLVAGIAMSAGRFAQPETAAPNVRRSTSQVIEQKTAETVRVEAAWNGTGQGDLSAPAADLEVPSVPGGQLKWHNRESGAEYWGYLTQTAGVDVGISVLKYYTTRAGWDVIFSEPMDTSGKGWTGVLTKPGSKVVVGVFALPLGYGMAPEGTRVSIVRIDAEGVQRIADSYVESTR